MSMDHAQQFFEYQNYLGNLFTHHPWVKCVADQQVDDALFREYLIQRTVLSNNFVPMYISAKRGMFRPQDADAKEVFREIILQELGAEKFPGLHAEFRKVGRFHGELLLEDLQKIGFDPEQVLIAVPSENTLETVQKLNVLIPSPADKHYALKTSVGMKGAGEDYPGKEFGFMLPRLKKLGLNECDSVFYIPHYAHDSGDLDRYISGCGDHTLSFNKVISARIVDQETLNIAKQSADQAFAARVNFYYSFSAPYWQTLNRQITKNMREIDGIDYDTIDSKEDIAKALSLKKKTAGIENLANATLDENALKEVYCNPNQVGFWYALGLNIAKGELAENFRKEVGVKITN